MRVLPLASLLLAGCNWITDADVVERQKFLDEDGDGYAAADDCDDGVKSIHPDAEEVWYDGVDTNCDKLDDYDQDQDGYTDPSGTGKSDLPGGDCDDTVATIHPVQTDAPYDGIDADCNGADDYDVDADLFVPTEYVGLATTGVAGSGALQGGDCDDTVATVNPAATETWYNGVDTDCNGADDYDRDYDGHVLVEYADLPTLYVDGSGQLPADDCDDDDIASYTGAEEVWYNGIDNNCDGSSDFDQDGDGFVLDDDCDDTKGSVHPGATERSGDGIDSDCDGGVSTAALYPLAGVTFTGAMSPVLVHDGDSLWLSLVAHQVKDTAKTWYESAYAFSWDLGDLRNSADAYSPQVWAGYTEEPPATVTSAHTITLVNGVMYGALGLLQADVRTVYLGAYTPTDDTFGSLTVRPSDELGEADDLALSVGTDGTVSAIACAANEPASWVRIGALDSIGMTPDADDVVDDIEARNCTLAVTGPAVAEIYTSTGSRVDRWDFDPRDEDLALTRTTVVNDGAFDVESYDTAAGTWYAWCGPTIGLSVREPDGTIHDVGEGVDNPETMDFWVDELGNTAMVWVDGAGAVRLATGTFGGTLTYQTLDADMTFTQAAVDEIDGTLVVVGAGSEGVAILMIEP